MLENFYFSMHLSNKPLRHKLQALKSQDEMCSQMVNTDSLLRIYNFLRDYFMNFLYK